MDTIACLLRARLGLGLESDFQGDNAFNLLLQYRKTWINRLGGEWLHPTGAGILADLGVDLVEEQTPHSPGRGFAIFPKGSDPIVLPYVGGELAVGCQHHLLIDAIHSTLARYPNVTTLAGHRVTDVARGRLTVAAPGRAHGLEVAAGLIVGADGRQSVVRQALGHAGAPRPVSYMAGVLIDAAVLPFADFGNVFLGRERRTPFGMLDDRVQLSPLAKRRAAFSVRTT